MLEPGDGMDGPEKDLRGHLHALAPVGLVSVGDGGLDGAAVGVVVGVPQRVRFATFRHFASFLVFSVWSYFFWGCEGWGKIFEQNEIC